MIGLALIIGIVAGMRSMLAPAAIAWAASCGCLALQGSWLAFFGNRYVPWVLIVLAIGELITDQLPTTPSRKLPLPFAARLLTGGVSGAAVGVIAGSWIGGLALGVVGAVIGTLGGAAFRSRLAARGSDRPGALIEDGVAILASAAVMILL